MEKPRLKLADLAKPITKVEKARQRFGQKFSFEPGSTWKPNQVPVLTQWLQTRGKS